jgi:pseudouridine synthase
MADAGVASRRECENLITQGLVEVNGARVDHLPVFVDPSNDRIVVDGRPLRPVRPSTAPAGPDAPRGVLPGRIYAMLHKPARVLCTTRDDGEGTPESGGRTTVTDLVQHSSGARLYPVGRLEYHATGLVLMTNDGALADRLTHARYGVTRTYRVTIKGRPTIELMRDLRRRLAAEKAETFEFPGRSTRGKRPDAGNDGPAIDPVRVVRRPGAMPAPGHTPDPSDNTVLEITLREGKSRQLKAILEQMGANTRKLTRVGIGPLRLRGVAVGQWRDLSREEVAALMRAGGLAPARQGKGA